MPRKGPAPRRELMPDPVYHSVLVTQLVNKVLSRGKRSLAERIVYDALEIVQEKAGAGDGVTPQEKATSVRAGRSGRLYPSGSRSELNREPHPAA